MSTITTARSALGAGIDPRGPRFAATLTSVVLAVVLVTPTPVAVGAPGRPDAWSSRSARCAASSTRRTPGSSGPSSGRGSERPRELEDPRPPRFAQAVGLGFAVVGPGRLPRRR